MIGNIVACVVLTIGLAEFTWIFTNPTRPRWAFWTLLFLTCAFIGLTIGLSGMWIFKTFLI